MSQSHSPTTDTHQARRKTQAGLIVIVLCVLALSFLMVPVVGGELGEEFAFENGSGTADDPYQISNVDQLQAMEEDLEAHYVLINHINASETEAWNDGKGFGPIGDQDTPFSGSFDGQGYEIENLYINRSNKNYVGLFGITDDGALVENVGIVDARVTGDKYVGTLVGRNYYGETSDSYATGEVSGVQWVGGLLGRNYGDLSDSYADSDVMGEDWYIGGLVGKNNGEVSDSYATGDVTEGTNLGGLVGCNAGDVSNSYATGEIVGEESVRIGGLVGRNREEGQISDSYATGGVSGGDDVGGLVGRNWGDVFDSYATGEVSGNENVGGLVGSTLGDGTVSNSYWNTKTSGLDASDGGKGRTTSDMTWEYADDTYDGWDFVETWMDGLHGTVQDHEGNVGYPALQWQERQEVYELEIRIDGEGSTEPSTGTHLYPENATVTVTADPDYDRVFVEWLVWEEVVVEDEFLFEADGETHYWEGQLEDSPVVEESLEIEVYPPDDIWFIVLSDDGEGNIVDDGDKYGEIDYETGEWYLNASSHFDEPPEEETTAYADYRYRDFEQYSEDSEITVIMNEDRGFAASFRVSFEGGAGTTDDPYQIANVDQLQAMEHDLDAHYILVDDIDAGETDTWNGGDGFDPIGEYDNRFSGSFDGQGYEIESLFIDRPDEGDVGLFGSVEGAIEDVGLVDVNVTGSSTVGGLVGSNYGVIDGSAAVGEVTGVNGPGQGRIVGGLTGSNFGEVTGSYASGTVSGNDMIGGLIGSGGGEVNDSYATSDVSGVEYGIVGLIGYHEVGSVESSYATGNVSGEEEVGGLIGFNFDEVRDSYAIGEVSGETAVGGLVGGSSGVVNSSFSDVNTTGQSDAIGRDEGQSPDVFALPSEEMKSYETYTAEGEYLDESWDIEIVWTERNDYPHLAWEGGTNSTWLIEQETAEAPYFEIEINDTTPSPIAEGDDFVVETEVHNTGDAEGTQDVRLHIGDPLSEDVDSRQLTLAPSEAAEVDLVWETDAGDAGSYDFKVDTDDDIDEGVVEVKEELEPAEFEVLDLAVEPEEVGPGEAVRVSASVTNVGDQAGEREVEFSVAGSVEGSETVELDPGDSATVEFETSRDAYGTYEVKIDAEDDFEAGNFTVAPVGEWVPYVPAADAVEIEILPENPSEDDEIVAEVVVVFSDQGHRVWDWGEVSRNDTVFSVDTEIERDDGPSLPAIKTVENSYPLGHLQEGDYEFRFMAWGEIVETKNFTVSEVEPAEFEVDDLAVDPEVVAPGDVVEVSAGVTNIGDEVGEQEVEFSVAGSVEDSETVNLDPGDSATVGFETSRDNVGTYEVEIDSEDDNETGSFTVEEALIEHELKIGVSGEGTTDPEPGTHTYEEGTAVTVEALPKEGWEFVRWMGDVEAEEKEIVVEMDEDKVIVAFFDDLLTVPEDLVEEATTPKYIPQMTPGSPGHLQIENTGIEEVRINVVEDVRDVSLSVKQLDSAPEWASRDPPGMVYKYYYFQVGNLTGERTENVEVTSKVSRAWIEDRGVDVDNLTMYRYDEAADEWEALSTAVVGEGDEYVRVQYVAEGFSLFSLTGEEDTPDSVFPWTLAAVVVVLAIAALVMAGYILLESSDSGAEVEES